MIGRDYKCIYCDKTYLSYPALYTHMKNKHAKGPDGQPLVNFNSGRGRGRPKKSSIGVNSIVEPTKIDYFRTMDKVGGPVEPSYGFSDIYTEIFIKKKTRRQIEQEMEDSEDAERSNAFADELNQMSQQREEDEIDEIENEEEV